MFVYLESEKLSVNLLRCSHYESKNIDKLIN